MPKRTKKRETKSERAYRLRMEKLAREQQAKKREEEKEPPGHLYSAGNALNAYASALDAIQRARIALRILLKTVHRKAEEAGRSPRELHSAISTLEKAERRFAAVRPGEEETLDLYRQAFLSLAKAYDDLFED